MSKFLHKSLMEVGRPIPRVALAVLAGVCLEIGFAGMDFRLTLAGAVILLLVVSGYIYRDSHRFKSVR